MAATDCKKYVGISFIILLAVFFVNGFVIRILLGINTSLFEVLDWWFVIGYLIQIATVAFIGFYQGCQSSPISKVGSVLYGILMILLIVNKISSKFTTNALLYFAGISEYFNSLVLYAPGLLLLAWGSKLWLPSKITFSLIVLLDVVADMIWAKLVPMYQNINYCSSFEDIDSLQSTADILGYVSSFTVLVTLILTIIWMCLQERIHYADRANINII